MSVRDICHEAQANVAAVNYHFAGKMGLYRAVVAAAAGAVVALTREAIRAGDGLAADERLRAYIRVHCAHMDAHGPVALPLQQIIHRELQEPTRMLGPLLNKVWRPRFEYLAATVGALLGLPATDERVLRSVVSIHAQIVLFRPSPVITRLGGGLRKAFAAGQVAEHIAAFSLAGLAAYRARS